MQRMLFFILCSVLFFPSLCRGSKMPVLRQQVTVTLIPAEKRLTGTSTLVIPAGKAGTLSLSVSDRTEVIRMAMDGDEVPFQFSGGMISVPLQERQGEATVSVEYRAVFDDPLPKLIVSSEDPTYGVSASISPSGTYLGGVGWYPEPGSTPPRRTFRITGPKGTRAVMAGRLVEVSDTPDGTTSVWNVEKPLSYLALSAGPYRVTERKVSGIPISTWLLSDDPELAVRYLKALEEYLPLYIQLLGPFPFEKFAVVENFLPTGYGYPSYTLIGGNVLRLPFILTTSLPHELVHNWWGNGVRVSDTSGNWSEGLTAYMADYLLDERRSPDAARDHRLKLLADYATLVPPSNDFPLAGFEGRVDAPSRAVGYGKAVMVFHLLRKVVGDEPFFRVLRQMAVERMYGSASWEDFGRMFSHASGKNVEGLVRELVHGTGGIELGLEGIRALPVDGGWQVSGAVRQGTLSYQIPVTLKLETAGGGEEKKTVPAGKGLTPFRFLVAAEPEALVMDPDAEIFRRLIPQELPPTVNTVKGSQRLLAVRCDSYRGDDATVKLLLESLGVKETQVVAEKSVVPEDLREHDLLFFGVPRGGLIGHGLPKGFSVSADRFMAQGSSYSAPAELLFLAARNPATPERVAAFFLPLSAEAGRKGVLKIQHYGRYGFLVFNGGQNVAKGSFPPADGPLVVRFSR